MFPTFALVAFENLLLFFTELLEFALKFTCLSLANLVNIEAACHRCY